MRSMALVVCAAIVIGPGVALAQAPRSSRPANRQRTASPVQVRRVVLYKNGIGYFEHVGRVRGNGSIALEFSSRELDDVLKSLTAIDLGGGRVTGVSYTAPVRVPAQPFSPSAADPNEDATAALLTALRGARVDVRARDATASGRLIGVDRRTSRAGVTQGVRNEISVVTDSGDIRTIELTQDVSVRLADRSTVRQVGTHLDWLASQRTTDERRLTVTTSGEGNRDLLVGYMSEIPVWKTSYRVLLAGAAEPRLEGWAIVDNTTSQDWTNVELSLVAGAPQSFVEKLSLPQFVTRPVVEAPRGPQPAPQTHDATLNVPSQPIPPRVGGQIGGASVTVRGGAAGIEGAVSGGVARSVITGEGGGVYQPAAAQPVGELFEYRVAAPVSISHNESALVPMISTTATVERVSLWNARTGAHPLRALWFTNTSGLTLDGGSFSVIDDGVFGGEGLIDPMKPGEKRLISYAVDLGVQVDSRQGDAARIMRRIVIDRGMLTAQREERARRVYTIRNNDAIDRAVVIEHPRRPGWTLVPGPAAAETSLTAYRFIVAVAAHHTETLIVEEAQPLRTEFQLSLLSDDQIKVIVDDSADLPGIRAALQEVAAAKARIARLSATAADRQAELGRLADDESRIRANMQSVGETRGSRTIVTRYTAQLTALDGRIDEIRRAQADLARETGEAEAALAALVDRLTIDVLRPN